MLDEATRTEPAEQERPPARSRKRSGAPVARVPLRARLRRDWALLVMVAPTLVLLGLFHYFPLLGNVIAFQDYSPYIGIVNSPFNGLENFQRLIDNPDFWNATRNTLAITGFQLVVRGFRRRRRRPLAATVARHVAGVASGDRAVADPQAG